MAAPLYSGNDHRQSIRTILSAFMKQRIFDKLGMTHSRIDNPERIILIKQQVTG
jgi:predicted Ser/Thr protein kinase